MIEILNDRDVYVIGGRVYGGLGNGFPIYSKFKPLMTGTCVENSATFNDFERIVLNMFLELPHLANPRITNNTT